MQTIEAIVIQGGISPRRPQLVRSLASVGWSVRDCAPGNLGELARTGPAQVVLLDAPAASLRHLIVAARNGAPQAVLIVLAPYGEVESRILALQAGADMACPLEIDVRELACLGRALLRLRDGVAPPAEANSPAWRLAEGGRVLAGPHGQRLPLTFAESAFFLRLLGAPGHRLPREQLVCAPPRRSARRQSSRSVDVLVSRLRAKAQRLGVQLPLLAVRQWGYILLADGGAAPDVHAATPPPGCRDALARGRSCCPECGQSVTTVGAECAEYRPTNN